MRVGALLLLLILAGFPVLLWSQPAGDGEQAPPPRAVVDALPDFTKFQLQGAASCAAAACHNGNGPKGSCGSEYTTWIVHDRHARAYEVLFDDRSKLIVKNYDNLPDWENAHPEEKPLCLNCHVHPNRTNYKKDRFRLEDGVSCEACHGPAEKWLTQHYTDSWKKRLTVADKEAQGMRDTKSLAGRARVCVDCHVGKPTSAVNHDLIAAGHPRLNFEFGAYHANMPHHWDDAKDKDAQRYPPKDDPRGRKPGKDFEARAWAIGQVVTAEAALKLLAHRAANDKLPWPEFAEYDCFACHHSLQGKSWRQADYLKDKKSPPGGKRPAGTYAWGTWYFSIPGTLAAQYPKAHVNLSVLKQLQKKMTRIYPDRKEVVARAEDAEKELDKLLEYLQNSGLCNAAGVADRFARLAEDQQALANLNWDSAEQLYLGLAAMHHAWKDLASPSCPVSLAAPLKDMASVLRFPSGFDSPDRDFSPKAFQKSLDALRKELGRY